MIVRYWIGQPPPPGQAKSSLVDPVLTISRASLVRGFTVNHVTLRTTIVSSSMLVFGFDTTNESSASLAVVFAVT